MLSASCQSMPLGMYHSEFLIQQTYSDLVVRFIPGHITLACTVSMSVILTIGMSLYLRRENARRDAWAVENNSLPENYTETEKESERTKGDNATFFRYTV